MEESCLPETQSEAETGGSNGEWNIANDDNIFRSLEEQPEDWDENMKPKKTNETETQEREEEVVDRASELASNENLNNGDNNGILSLEEAAAKINPSHLAAFLVEASVRYV